MTDDHRPLIHRSEFRFYGQLNDFLPAAHRQRAFSFGYSRTPSVRDTRYDPSPGGTTSRGQADTDRYLPKERQATINGSSPQFMRRA